MEDRNIKIYCNIWSIFQCDRTQRKQAIFHTQMCVKHCKIAFLGMDHIKECKEKFQ